MYSYYLCLSHDVDRVYKTYQPIYYSLKSLFKKDFNGFFYHLSSIKNKHSYWNFENIIAIEENLGVKSTFFFLNESIPFDLTRPDTFVLSLGRYSWDEPKISKMIKQIDQKGWEIGLHGSFNSYNDFDLLKSEKEKLEKILGHKIFGVRQHYLNLDKSTWSLQRKLDFLYDSTLGSIKDVGFPEQRYYPFSPFNDEFKVVPLVIMDICLMSKPNPTKVYGDILKIAEEKNAIVTLNWHQRVFNEMEFPNYSNIYKEIIYKSLNRGAFVGSIKQVLDIY